MKEAVIVLSGVSLLALCTAGAFYALFLQVKRERNEFARDLTEARKAISNLKSELQAIVYERDTFWKRKPKHGDHGRFVKPEVVTKIASSPETTL